MVAFGPRLSGIGSWEWIGADLIDSLAGEFDTRPFEATIPKCDVVVVVKYEAARIIPQVPLNVPILFCPVDAYGSSAEIDRDWALLRRCARVIVHAEPLRRYFHSYAPVEYLDHHLKFAAPLREEYRAEGPILWAGLRSNLPPLADWVNRHGLPCELVVLTDLDANQNSCLADRFGFQPGTGVRIETWSAERQRELTAAARAAIDVKGDDFRQRQKPPAKALDFVASGVPLAMNRESSSARHLKRIGFEIAEPADRERWFSRDYWEETHRFGESIRRGLSRERVARRFAAILREVLAEGRKPQ